MAMRRDYRIPIIFVFLLSIVSYYGMAALGVGDLSDWGSYATILIEVMGLFLITGNVNIILKSKMCRQWLPWILVMLLYSFFYNPMPHGVISFAYPIFCPIVFLLSYVLTYKYVQSERVFIYFFSISLIVLSYLCFSFSNELAQDINTDFYVSNLVFYPLCCVPFVFLIERKGLKYILLALLFIIILYSQKRAAALCFLVIIGGLILWDSHGKKNLATVLFIIIAIFFMESVIMDSYFDNMVIRMKTMNEDGGSGRMEIFPIVWASLSDNDWIMWLFGKGEGSIILTGFPNAHNDALQLLFEYGIIGLSFYVFFLIRVIKETIALLKKRSYYSIGYFSCLAVIIIMGAVSNLFTFYSFFAYLCVYMGMVEGRKELNRRLVIES